MLVIGTFGDCLPIKVTVVSAKFNQSRVAVDAVFDLAFHNREPFRRGAAKLCAVDQLDVEPLGYDIRGSRFTVCVAFACRVPDDTLCKRVSPDDDRFPF